jgi:hypothetical protein
MAFPIKAKKRRNNGFISSFFNDEWGRQDHAGGVVGLISAYLTLVSLSRTRRPDLMEFTGLFL